MTADQSLTALGIAAITAIALAPIYVLRKHEEDVLLVGVILSMLMGLIGFVVIGAILSEG